MKPRVLFVGTMGIPPKYGGFETCVYEVTKRLKRMGFKPVVMCAIGWHKYFKKLPREFEGIELCWIIQTGIPVVDRVLREIFPIIFSYKDHFDIVHIFGPSLFNKIWKMRKIRVVLSTDGFEWKRDSYNKIVKFFVHLGYLLGVKTADIVTCDSKFICRWFKANWGRDSIYLPYGSKEYREKLPNLARWGLVKNGYYLFVGRLIPEKGLEFMIECFKKIDTNKNLIIMGEDTFGGSYERRLKRISSSNVLFLGYQKGSNYEALSRGCYVHLRPSTLNAEGTSPVLIDAMHFKSCILASDTPNNLEALGKSGFYFQRGNPDSFLKKMNFLEKNPIIVEEMGKKAFDRPNKAYNWVRIVKKLEVIYIKLVRARRV